MLVRHHGFLAAEVAAIVLEDTTMKRLLALIASLVLVPFRMAKGAIQWILQPGPTPAAEEDVAATRAENAEEAQQRRADDAADNRELAQHMRKVIFALASGNKPDPEHLQRLPKPVADYVAGLTQEECRTLLARPSRSLRQILDGYTPDGVRSPAQVAGDQAASQLQASGPKPTLVADRIQQRRPVRSVDAILADMQLAA